jgi:hypothetical protein
MTRRIGEVRNVLIDVLDDWEEPHKGKIMVEVNEL